MNLRNFGLKVKGGTTKVARPMKQLTLLDFGLTFDPHPNQTTLLEYQEGDSHD